MKNGKLFGVLNPIDILAILGVAVVGAFLVWFILEKIFIAQY